MNEGILVSRAKSRRDATLGSGAVVLVFALSGAAGLIYQVVWSRELVLIFGSTSQAVSTIVAAFMAGLGLGGLAGGAWARRTQHPLRAYGLVEASVGVFALLVPLAFGQIAEVYRAGFSSLSPGQLALERFALAFVVVSPVTFLMGTTLPLLTRFFVRSMEHAGPMLGRLYAVNTLGATLGTLVSGFLLIEFIGLSGTTRVAVGMNLTAGAVALLVQRRQSRTESSGGDASLAISVQERPPAAEAKSTRLRPLFFLMTFVSGFVAIALEVLWTREISEGTGSMIYIFVGILAVYLIGITTGSRLYQRRSSPNRDTPATLAALFIAVGVIAALTVALGSIPVAQPHRVDPASFVLPGLRVGLLLVAMLIATTLMGYTFPLTGRMVTRTSSEAGQAVGFLYGANTFGGILGAFASTFLLAGTLGTPRSILLLAVIEMVSGVAIGTVASERSFRVPRLAQAGTAAAVIAILLALVLDIPLTRTSTQNQLAQRGLPMTHAEDAIATVDAVGGPPIERDLYVTGVGMTKLTVDTKLMAYLPKVARPEANRFLVIAFGMGSTYRSGLIAGMQTDAVDLSPSVPKQMGMFFPDAANYLNNAHGKIISADGRNYVRLSPEKYDIIAVDPPPPIESAGTVVLYSREFIDQSKARLNPGGVMMLWMPYSLPLDDYKTHIRTFRASFQHVQLIFSPAQIGMYILGSDAPMSFDAADTRRILSAPEATADLSDSPDRLSGDPAAWADALQQKLWLSDDQVDRFVGPGDYITDDRPRSEYFLWRRLFTKNGATVTEARLRAAAS